MIYNSTTLLIDRKVQNIHAEIKVQLYVIFYRNIQFFEGFYIIVIDCIYEPFNI